jgi:hypothetical protein
MVEIMDTLNGIPPDKPVDKIMLSVSEKEQEIMQPKADTNEENTTEDINTHQFK